jgi:hypothetical protein
VFKVASVLPKSASEAAVVNDTHIIDALEERYNHSPFEHTVYKFPFWNALGDSFSAGNLELSTTPTFISLKILRAWGWRTYL